MTPDDYAALDATAVAGAVRSGEVSVAEVHAAATECHLRTHGDINAMVEWYEAPTAPTALDGSLAGVPFVRKDYGSAEAGRLVEMGSALAAGMRAPVTGEYIRRLQAAGAHIVGRSAVPELIQHGTTESRVHGATRNPHNLAYSAGGSSGGSGAAVAAGVAPIGHGSDCAGSIRIPAATCGLIGLKPSRRLVPWEGGGWDGIAEEFVLTRTVRDSVLLLDILADDPAPPTTAPLRIAFDTSHWAGASVDPFVDATTRAIAAHLEHLGHRVTEIATPHDHELLMSTWHALFSSWVGRDARRAAAATGRAIDATTVEPMTLLAIAAADALTDADRGAAAAARTNVTDQLVAAMADHDLLLTPSLGRTAIPLGVVAGEGTSMAAYIEANDVLMPYSYLFNVTGWAAASIPAAVGPEGIPVGVQLAGPAGTEHTILHLAHELT